MSKKVTNEAVFSTEISDEKFEFTGNATIVIEDIPTPEIVVTKTASPETVYAGDTVSYRVDIVIPDTKAKLLNQTFSDILPEELEFIEGTLKLNGVVIEGDPSEIVVEFEANSNNYIEYQCLVK